MTLKQWADFGIRVGACVFLVGLEAYQLGREQVKRLSQRRSSRSWRGMDASKATPREAA